MRQYNALAYYTAVVKVKRLYAQRFANQFAICVVALHTAFAKQIISILVLLHLIVLQPLPPSPISCLSFFLSFPPSFTVIRAISFFSLGRRLFGIKLHFRHITQMFHLLLLFLLFFVHNSVHSFNTQQMQPKWRKIVCLHVACQVNRLITIAKQIISSFSNFSFHFHFFVLPFDIFKFFSSMSFN